MPNGAYAVLTKVVDTVRESGARSLVTILTAGASLVRPCEISRERHLRIAVSDIDAPRGGHVLPGEEHINRLLAFLEEWDRSCAARHTLRRWGEPIARGGFCRGLRFSAASQRNGDRARTAPRLAPTATPNRRMVALADERLERNGRMSAAIAAIGRGTDCYEGAPFALEFADA